MAAPGSTDGASAQSSLWITVLVMGGYFLIARLVGDLYPFSTFSMYSNAKSASASHVVARDGAGGIHEVFSYEGWSCPGPVDIDPPKCSAAGAYGSIGYVDRNVLDHVQGSRAAEGRGGEPVELVRRIWRFEESSGHVRTEDCVLARCQATRR